MSKAEEFLACEKARYGKVFVDISYAINDVSPFIERDALNKRKYAVKLPVLKKYIDLLEAGEVELKKGGVLSFLNNDKSVELIKDFKSDNLQTLKQLEKCADCACLKCTAVCKFDSCHGCRESSSIRECDHSRINVTAHDGFTLDLTNDRTGATEKYNVLATLQNAELNRKYIIIENMINRDKFILYYYPGISEDTYGEITDSEEFDFIVSTFDSVNL